MEDLLDKAINQNYVPVVDDQGYFIGIITRKEIIKYCYKELKKYIKASDLFVCSSRAEGFSTVVSEAIVLEKPIIATKCSGMKELLGENEEYGIVCENSTNALYASIKKILEEKNEYDLLKEKIKERKEIFDIDKSIKRIEQLLLN